MEEIGPTTPIWVVRAGKKGKLLADFESKNLIAIGFRLKADLSALGLSEIRAQLKQQEPDLPVATANNWAGQLFRFAHQMQGGDLVITPDTETRELLFGRIAGEYRYSPGSTAPEFPHIRSVSWIGRRPRDVLPKRVLYSLGAISTLFQPGGREHLLALLEQKEQPPETRESESETETAETADLLADLRSRSEELIWSDLAGLDAYATQDLVAGLLRAMGYRHTRVSPPGADQGVDIEASRDPLRLEQRVKVQVKARPNTRTGAPEVLQLAGNLGPGERGIFVSTGGFTAQAESHPSAQDIVRIDGSKLLELLIDHYERLDPSTRALLPLKRLYFPAR